MKNNIVSLAFAGLLAAAVSAPAATVVFDNTSGHPGGMLTFGTGAMPGPATLSNGVVDLVTRLDGSSVSSYSVSASDGFNCGVPMGGFGCVNFSTGSFRDQSTVGETTTYRFNPGGNLMIAGMADGAFGVLFSSMGFDSIVTLNVNNATGLSSLSGTLTPGVLNPTLANALGVSPNSPGGTNTSSSIMVTLTGGTGMGMATTNSIQLSAAAVPEPGSMVMLGSGLIGVAAALRRRTRQQAS